VIPTTSLTRPSSQPFIGDVASPRLSAASRTYVAAIMASLTAYSRRAPLASSASWNAVLAWANIAENSGLQAPAASAARCTWLRSRRHAWVSATNTMTTGAS
jgi:hypothetical protein